MNTEHDKLIAEFMEHEPTVEYVVGNKGENSYCYSPSSLGYSDHASQKAECDRFIGRYPNSDFKTKRIEWHKDYAADWNDLMAVVDKIESLGFKFKMCRSRVEVYYDNDDPVAILSKKYGTKKLSVYVAIQEFIRWYKKQQSEMSVHHNLLAIQDMASYHAQQHKVRYTVFQAPGGTFEFVIDSYWQKERPGARKITEHMPDGTVVSCIMRVLILEDDPYLDSDINLFSKHLISQGHLVRPILSCLSHPKEVVEAIESFEPTVIFSQTTFNNMDQIKDMRGLLSMFTNRPRKTEIWLQSYRAERIFEVIPEEYDQFFECYSVSTRMYVHHGLPEETVKNKLNRP